MQFHGTKYDWKWEKAELLWIHLKLQSSKVFMFLIIVVNFSWYNEFLIYTFLVFLIPTALLIWFFGCLDIAFVTYTIQMIWIKPDKAYTYSVLTLPLFEANVLKDDWLHFTNTMKKWLKQWPKPICC